MNKLNLILCAVVVVFAGCSSMVHKAEKASKERAEKFTDAELCKHLKEDGNDYYEAANKAEVEKRGLSCP